MKNILIGLLLVVVTLPVGANTQNDAMYNTMVDMLEQQSTPPPKQSITPYMDRYRKEQAAKAQQKATAKQRLQKPKEYNKIEDFHDTWYDDFMREYRAKEAKEKRERIAKYKKQYEERQLQKLKIENNRQKERVASKEEKNLYYIDNKTVSCVSKYLQNFSANSNYDIHFSRNNKELKHTKAACFEFYVPQGYIGVITAIPKNENIDPDITVSYRKNQKWEYKKSNSKGSDLLFFPQLGVLGRDNVYKVFAYAYNNNSGDFKLHFHLVDVMQEMVYGGFQGAGQELLNAIMSKLLEMATGTESTDDYISGSSNNISRMTSIIFSQLSESSIKEKGIDFTVNEISIGLQKAEINPFFSNIVLTAISRTLKKIYKYQLI